MVSSLQVQYQPERVNSTLKKCLPPVLPLLIINRLKYDCAVGTCTTQTIHSEDYELFLNKHKTIIHLCIKY